MNQKEAFTGRQICQHLDLDFPVSGTLTNTCLLFISRSVYSICLFNVYFYLFILREGEREREKEERERQREKHK